MAQVASLSESGYRPCVGIMLLNEEGHVFVGRRVDVADDAWQMPQGGIRDNETPRAAAYRELKEEIGTGKAEVLAESATWFQYDLPRDLREKAWGGRWHGQRQKWFVMRFTGFDGEINVNTKHPEFNAWKWVSIDELPNLIVSFKRQVYLDLFAEFAELTRRSGQTLAELMADPIVRMTMAADKINEMELYELLRHVAKRWRSSKE
jgi:putative (di)nucleoside polyphosphate hydrolase